MNTFFSILDLVLNELYFFLLHVSHFLQSVIVYFFPFFFFSYCFYYHFFFLFYFLFFFLIVLTVNKIFFYEFCCEIHFIILNNKGPAEFDDTAMASWRVATMRECVFKAG